MINLTISSNRNVDPVRFRGNRIRVFLGKGHSCWLWIDEDRLFEFLSDDQKRQYLLDKRDKELVFPLGVKVAKKIVEIGYTAQSKGDLLSLLSEFEK